MTTKGLSIEADIDTNGAIQIGNILASSGISKYRLCSL